MCISVSGWTDDCIFRHSMSERMSFFSLYNYSLPDIDEKDNDLNTPLHVACAAGNKDGVEFLLSHNADSTLQNKCKATPLHVVVEKDHPQLIQVVNKFTTIHCLRYSRLHPKSIKK